MTDNQSTDKNTNPYGSLKVLLASSSPRRHELLKGAGIRFDVRLPQNPIDESLDPDQLQVPVEAAKKLAEQKAGSVVQELLAENRQGLFMVIGADTMVVKDGEIFGKPRNLDDAKRMLNCLSNDTHDVITAVSVWMVASDGHEDVTVGYRTFCEKSEVRFKVLTESQIEDYLRQGESFDKAGAYAIQGKGAELVEDYKGDFDNIVGLPVTRLLKEFPELKCEG